MSWIEAEDADVFHFQLTDDEMKVAWLAFFSLLFAASKWTFWTTTRMHVYMYYIYTHMYDS